MDKISGRNGAQILEKGGGTMKRTVGKGCRVEKGNLGDIIESFALNRGDVLASGLGQL